VSTLSSLADPAATGASLFALVAELFPLHRSITGDGVRQTLARLRPHIPLEIHEVPSGTRVFDWTVPDEWNVREAWIADATGRRVLDIQHSTLHLVHYSVPVRARLSLAELRPHLFSLPEAPDLVPYRTSYYAPSWGFCLAHRQLTALADGEYDVCIDVSLAPGSLTYGECFLPGETDDEVLISTHICHPSLANDNCSGIAVATALAQALATRASRRYGYRFVFVPGTIGSITWLARNEVGVDRVRHGLVLAGLGDASAFTYKKSRRGNAEIDRVVPRVLKDLAAPHAVRDFTPYGYDERQYCSPGFDLPVGCLMRTPHGAYPEYHTSADDLAFVRPERLHESLRLVLAVVDALEANRAYVSQNPKCEPQLGRRGLYATLGGIARHTEELALLWTLNLADGHHTVLDIAERSGMPLDAIDRAARALSEHGLLKEAS
jgi:aminopeptidase-like protein